MLIRSPRLREQFDPVVGVNSVGIINLVIHVCRERGIKQEFTLAESRDFSDVKEGALGPLETAGMTA